ncbi:unnamed protein product [Rotaria sp. Silwood1]|nr:unnamed protein product [Rotaria sp. Silwood1]CAF4812487.1 unnamed protein product [Rotaria sp. Silwood1]
MASSKIIGILKPMDYDENSERYKSISILIVSDTHKNHEKINIPDGDIFLHCGDFTNKDDWRNLTNDQIPQSVIDFNQWLGRLTHKHKIVICGNHEIVASTEPCSICNNTVHGSYGHWDSKSLIKEIRQKIQPRIHCFGHVHDDNGYKYDQHANGTLFINAAANLTRQCFKLNFYLDLQKHSNMYQS